MLYPVVVQVLVVQHSQEEHAVEPEVPRLLGIALLSLHGLLALFQDREGGVIQCPLEEVFLCAPLHFYQEFLAVGCPADDVEYCPAVLFHDSQLLGRKVCDVLDVEFRENDFKEFNEDVLVYFRAE